MTSTDIAVGIAVVLGVLLIAAVIAGLRAGGATRSASQRAADAGERLAASRKRLTELEVELYEARRQLAAHPASPPDPPGEPAPPDPVTVLPAGGPAQPDAGAAASDSGAAAEAPDDTPLAVDGAISPATPELDQDGDVIAAVWELQRLELDVQRQREAGIMAATTDVDEGTLVGALQREVERIREEMGTPGELHNELPGDPEGRAGLLMLDAVRMTLGVLARRCQAFDLRIEAEDDRFGATIVCEGFEVEFTDETAAALGAIAAAMAKAGATAAFSPGADGAAHAELSFPAR